MLTLQAEARLWIHCPTDQRLSLDGPLMGACACKRASEARAPPSCCCCLSDMYGTPTYSIKAVLPKHNCVVGGACPAASRMCRRHPGRRRMRLRRRCYCAPRSATRRPRAAKPDARAPPPCSLEPRLKWNAITTTAAVSALTPARCPILAAFDPAAICETCATFFYAGRRVGPRLASLGQRVQPTLCPALHLRLRHTSKQVRRCLRKLSSPGMKGRHAISKCS
jgi:hypothetical protein